VLKTGKYLPGLDETVEKGVLVIKIMREVKRRQKKMLLG
jgi:hypothetical protein